MSAFGEASETEPRSVDPVTRRLDEILDQLAAVVADNTPVRDAARIDRIARLEKLRAATAALQVAKSVRFAQSQVAEQLAADGPHTTHITTPTGHHYLSRVPPTMRTDASEETDRIDKVGQDQHDTRDQYHPSDNVGHWQ
jgi:hypothetical protein